MEILSLFKKKKQPNAPRDHHAPPRLLDGEKVYSENDWHQRVIEIVDGLPWFGQGVGPARSGVRRPKGERITTEDQRRVLVSWLGGGSAAQVARRAGVSRRSVYNILKKLIYVQDPMRMMAIWSDLGLIACVITPECIRQDTQYRSPQVVCLICHRRVTPHYGTHPRKEVGEVFRPSVRVRREVDVVYKYDSAIGGHLVLHFLLDFYISNRRFRPYARSESWHRIHKRVRAYAEANWWVRDTETVPIVHGKWDDAEDFKKWRVNILERKSGEPLAPPI